MNLLLERYESGDTYTAGRLLLWRGAPLEHEFICWTVERPWLDNQPNISCIPEDTYYMRPWQRPNNDWAYILGGGCLCDGPGDLTEADPKKLRTGLPMKLVSLPLTTDDEGNEIHTFAFAPLASGQGA